MATKPFIAVVVDFQKDFIMPGGALHIEGAEELRPRMEKYLKSLCARPGFHGVLFTYDTHSPDIFAKSEESKLFPIHCIPGALDLIHGISVLVHDKDRQRRLAACFGK